MSPGFTVYVIALVAEGRADEWGRGWPPGSFAPDGSAAFDEGIAVAEFGRKGFALATARAAADGLTVVGAEAACPARVSGGRHVGRVAAKVAPPARISVPMAKTSATIFGCIFRGAGYAVVFFRARRRARPGCALEVILTASCIGDWGHSAGRLPAPIWKRALDRSWSGAPVRIQMSMSLRLRLTGKSAFEPHEQRTA